MYLRQIISHGRARGVNEAADSYRIFHLQLLWACQAIRKMAEKSTLPSGEKSAISATVTSFVTECQSSWVMPTIRLPYRILALENTPKVRLELEESRPSIFCRAELAWFTAVKIKGGNLSDVQSFTEVGWNFKCFKEAKPPASPCNNYSEQSNNISVQKPQVLKSRICLSHWCHNLLYIPTLTSTVVESDTYIDPCDRWWHWPKLGELYDDFEYRFDLIWAFLLLSFSFGVLCQSFVAFCVVIFCVLCDSSML